MSTQDERAAGCLWGLAWGDVLGAPVEGWSATEIASAFGVYAGLPAALPGERRRRQRRLGLHTDDTQQALALLNVCLSAEGWSPAAWGRCLVRGAQLKAWRGTGRHFDAAVTRLSEGIAPEHSGSASSGIGAAMRTAPLGALFCAQPQYVTSIAAESSAVTHADLLAITLGYAVAFAAARFVGGDSSADVRRQLPSAVARLEQEWLGVRPTVWTELKPTHHRLSESLVRLFQEPQTALIERVLKIGTTGLNPGAHPHPNHGFALLGGLTALGVALQDDVEPQEELLRLIRMGGDTDTVGAIAGGLFGARFGSAWVPKSELTGAEHISLYAKSLITRQHPESLEALLHREHSLS